MNIKSIATLVLACAMLPACAAANLLEDAKGARPATDGFTQNLYAVYIERAEDELLESDRGNSKRFSEKALTVSSSGDVEPDDFSVRDIDSEYRGDLTVARQRLVEARNSAAREIAAAALARAQISFECWMEEREEDWQENHIAACRKQFEDAMNTVDLALANARPAPPAPMPPAPMPEPEPAPLPGPYVVYFDFDSSTLTDAAKAVLDRAVGELSTRDDARLSVSGHTDQSGASAYNTRLAERRAAAVAAYLTERGLSGSDMRVGAFGENQPAVSPSNEGREAKNRRVQIDVDWN